MYTHIRGSTFSFIGQMQNDGVVQDLTNATLVANVYDETGTILYGNLTVVILTPTTDGLVNISYANTLPWPVGRARIDCVLTIPNPVSGQPANVIASDPVWFRIKQNPILG
jgi:hypothetical protein